MSYGLSPSVQTNKTYKTFGAHKGLVTLTLEWVPYFSPCNDFPAVALAWWFKMASQLMYFGLSLSFSPDYKHFFQPVYPSTCTHFLASAATVTAFFFFFFYHRSSSLKFPYCEQRCHHEWRAVWVIFKASFSCTRMVVNKSSCQAKVLSCIYKVLQKLHKYSILPEIILRVRLLHFLLGWPVWIVLDVVTILM